MDAAGQQVKLKILVVALSALIVCVYFNWDSALPSATESQFVLSGGSGGAPRAAAHLSSEHPSAPSVHTAAPLPQYKPFAAYTYVPTTASAHQPLQVLVALHGMGGEGKGFAAPLIKEAERNGWLLVAPTIPYGDWHNPDQVAQEDVEIAQRLIATIDLLSEQMHLAVKPQVHLIGFSRGAQVAHRFALFFPDHVDRVVAFSAGTYTLPFRTRDIDGDGQADMIVLPYGAADMNKRVGHPINPIRLKQVRFLIGVGGSDNVANDVPRQWDAYVGKTRLERAHAFVDALKSQGMHCTLQVFPGVGHEVTNAMWTQAVQFLSSSDLQLN